MRLAEEIALASGDAEVAVTVVRPSYVWGPFDRTRLPKLIREAQSGGIDLCGDGKNLVGVCHVSLVADVAYDLVYNPPQTKLLADAVRAGCRTIGGLDMLVAQAQAQFEWWTGQRPADRVMRDAALARLQLTETR